MINYTEKEILEILKDEQKTDEFLATLTGEDVKKLLTYIPLKEKLTRIRKLRSKNGRLEGRQCFYTLRHCESKIP